ncbi:MULTISPECIES: RNA polymerase sigma factor [Kitasatospora]|uniref:RNA polymerase sigma factor (Sigma-70 family) n=2 Tax=Kitasatospora TaxID=2063 RepID=A0ABT1IX48_9ACTN|nr:RNA polymerase sigma factor [Kitasatospora paracochleata]MCP2309726.1 RNA polymerase sigma factor (sigma-70 family) [Kitasatospora paracochleata]
MTAPDARTATDRTVAAVWRMESARITGALTRLVHDFGTAEELAQDALLAALEQWPVTGVPDRPGAWLMATARNRAVDLIRRERRYSDRLAELGRRLDTEPPPQPEDLVLDAEPIEDDVLRLVFTACHPVLSAEARAALTLRVVGGLRTEEIARAFLTAETTVAQRIVRAKKTLARAAVGYEVPEGPELAGRLASVLEVLYLIFNEGYAATAGDDWMRPALCEEAMRLGRVLAGLMPAEAEVHGLVALMELQASRTPARTGPDGAAVLLPDQDRSRWDRMLIHRGFTALERARTADPPGPYTLQAEIAACHARAATAEATDWVRIAALYAALAQRAPSPVVELNRAVAVSMAFGPAAGLDLADRLAALPALREYHLLPVVRGDLLARLGRHPEAAAEFGRAAAMTRNTREREVLLGRAEAERARG